MGKATDSVQTTGNGATGVANAFTTSQWGQQNQAQMNQALSALLNGRPGDPTSLQQYFGAGMGNNGMVNFGAPNANPNNIPVNNGYTRPTNPFMNGPVGNPFATQSMVSDVPPANFSMNSMGGGMMAPPQTNMRMMQVDPFANNEGDNPFLGPTSGSSGDPQTTPTNTSTPTTVAQTAAQPYVNPFSATPMQPQNMSFADAAFNPTAISGQYNAPSFAQTQLNGVNTNFDAGPLPTVSGTVNGFNAGPNTMQGFGTQANLGSINSPEAQRAAMAAIMGDQQASDIAALRERFGNQGLSTGAQLAEAQYRAQSTPQIALALDQIQRDNNNQFLTQRGQDLQNQQGNRGIDVQQLGLGVDQAGQANQFNLGAGGLGLQGQQANQQAAIAQMNANLQAMGMSNDAILALNNQILGQNNSLNAFNQGNAQFGATFGQNAGQLNNAFNLNAAQLNQGNQFANINAGLQNQQQGNQFALGMQGIGAQREGTQQQAMIAALTQMMQNLRQTQALGTPQAENLVKGGWLDGVAGIIQGIGDAIPG